MTVVELLSELVALHIEHIRFLYFSVEFLFDDCGLPGYHVDVLHEVNLFLARVPGEDHVFRLLFPFRFDVAFEDVDHYLSIR